MTGTPLAQGLRVLALGVRGRMDSVPMNSAEEAIPARDGCEVQILRLEQECMGVVRPSCNLYLSVTMENENGRGFPRDACRPRGRGGGGAAEVDADEEGPREGLLASFLKKKLDHYWFYIW